MANEVLTVRSEERTYPPYNAFHGTPSAMLWRRVTIETGRGSVAFEQTDYGHAGRLNAWEPRDMDLRLAAKVSELRGIAEAVSAFVR